MLFHFVNSDQVHSSVIQTYSKFIESYDHVTIMHSSSLTVPANASVVWWFCGNVPLREADRLRSGFQVHEYHSASFPPYAWLKDEIKKWTNPSPDFRIFQNGWIREKISFSDNIPYGFRDVGVDDHFFEIPARTVPTEFDFVYYGELFHLLEFKNILQAIYDAGRTLLLIGEMPTELQPLLTSNITYISSMNQMEVPQHLRRARFGLNLVTNTTPFNQQASPKVLQYCAAGLRVVSNAYPWIRYFTAHHNANFYFIPEDRNSIASNLSEALEAFPYVVPEIRELSPLNIIKKSAIWKIIRL